jgi:hypothetical protein
MQLDGYGTRWMINLYREGFSDSPMFPWTHVEFKLADMLSASLVSMRPASTSQIRKSLTPQTGVRRLNFI